MYNKMVRPCGASWEYCDGICIGCIKNRTVTSTAPTVTSTSPRYDYETVYHKETTTDGKLRWFGVYSGEHIQ